MIGQQLREIRTERQMSLTELAQRADVAKSYLSAIERGIRTNPSIGIVAKLCEVLEIPIQNLIESSEPWHKVGDS